MERYDWGGGEWRHNEFVEYLRRIVAGLGLKSRTEKVATTFTGPPPAPYDVDAVPTHVRQTVLPIVSGFLGAAPGSGFAELGLAAVPVPQTRGGPVDSIVITNHSVGTATARSRPRLRVDADQLDLADGHRSPPAGDRPRTTDRSRFGRA